MDRYIEDRSLSQQADLKLQTDRRTDRHQPTLCYRLNKIFISEQTDLTWTDTEKIGHYLNRLREYTEKLARQNNQLASYHKQVY